MPTNQGHYPMSDVHTEASQLETLLTRLRDNVSVAFD